MNTDTLRILSHNAYWFQGHPFSDSRPGPPNPPILGALARLYRELSPDAVCLQEVQDEPSFAEAASALKFEGHYCPGGRRPHYGGAVFWRRGRYLGDWRDAPATPQRVWQVFEVPLRPGVAVSVAGVHLTSARHMSEAEASCTRVADLTCLLDVGKKPIVIAGDFNEPPSGSASAFLAHQGYIDVATLVDDAPASTGVNKSRSDQIWLLESCLPAFRGFTAISWERLACHVPGKTTLSDHLPLYVDLDARVVADLLEP